LRNLKVTPWREPPLAIFPVFHGLSVPDLSGATRTKSHRDRDATAK
jgi:hypothetical protein